MKLKEFVDYYYSTNRKRVLTLPTLSSLTPGEWGQGGGMERDTSLEHAGDLSL